MNRKGFTLIELIATIAILAVIALISFVSITKVIEKSRIDNCNILVENIKTSAEEYASDNRYNSAFVSEADKNGNKVTITADSIEIIFPDTCIIRDDLTIEYPLTDDCELLSWDYEKFGFNGFKGVYDVSDWSSFLMTGLRCKDIKTIK